MKSSAYVITAALLASQAAAQQADCATDVSALESVLSCLTTLNVDYTSQTTNTVALYSGACSWQKAAIGCASSFCGDTYPSISAWDSRSATWCKGGASATPTPTSSVSGSQASASATAAVTAAKSTAGVGSSGFTDGGVLLAAAAGIVGVVL